MLMIFPAPCPIITAPTASSPPKHPRPFPAITPPTSTSIPRCQPRTRRLAPVNLITVDEDGVSVQINRRRRREALSGRDVELGLVEGAFNCAVLDESLRQHCIFVAADVIDRIELVV